MTNVISSDLDTLIVPGLTMSYLSPISSNSGYVKVIRDKLESTESSFRTRMYLHSDSFSLLVC